MYNKRLALGMLAMMEGIGPGGMLHGGQRFVDREYTPEEIAERRQAKVKANAPAIAQANGLKPFNIDGTIVYAINKKNAEKKYKKQLIARTNEENNTNV